MAGTIYATMRKYDKTLHNQSNALKARAERHAEHLAASRVDPRQTLRVGGVRCRFHNDILQHKAIEALEGGIPWNGHEDNIIDRFDGRALLDFYREPVQRPPKEKDEDESELEDRLNFESYRDLVKLLKQNTPEEEALQTVEKNEMEASAQKEYDRSLKNKDKNKESKPDSAYATIGFSYASASNSERNRANADSEEDGSDSSGSSDDDSESDGDDSEPSDGGSSGSDKDEGVGKIAKEFDIRNFRKLSRRDRQEEKEREENPHNPRLPFGRPNPLGSRRQRRKNVRALQSQGVTDRDAYRAISKQAPPSAPLAPALRPSYQRRSSPSYDSYHRRSRSRSPRHGSRRQDDGREELPVQREYITAFGSAADADNNAEEARRDRTSNHINRRRSPPSSSRPILEANGRRDPAELATSSSHHSSERGNPPPTSSSSYVPKYKGAAAGGKLSAGGGAGGDAGAKKETPMERLKRLTSARLNKQITKDTVKETGKLQQMQKEREYKADHMRRARDEQLSAEMAERYAPRRSRSRSPRRYSRHSRSPTPERDTRDTRQDSHRPESHRSGRHRSRSPERHRSRSPVRRK